MKNIEIRDHAYKKMEEHLENTCAYLATGDKQLFYYHGGKADAYRDIFEEAFGFDERYASEHIKNMWEIMDENW